MKRYDVPPAERMNREVGLLLAMLDDGTREWRGELGDVPDEAVVWQPFPNGHSIGAVILHIAAVEVHWLHRVAGGREPWPEEEERLQAAARQQGLAISECARRLLAGQLPPLPPGDATLALLDAWDAEDATDDPGEIASRIREWEELEANLAANRLALRSI